MSAVGRSKARYVGGWAIRKILENFVKVNIYRENKKTLQKVHRHHRMCELLEENVMVPFAKLSESTKGGRNPRCDRSKAVLRAQPYSYQ